MVVDDDECVENKAPPNTIGRHNLNESNAILWRVRIGRAWINSLVVVLVFLKRENSWHMCAKQDG